MNGLAIMRMPTENEGTTSAALQSFESTMAAVRDVGPGTSRGFVIHSLGSLGHENLDTRVRSAARSRGALAHPDTTLVRDILRAGDKEGMLDALQRRAMEVRSQPETPPQAVHPLVAAEPSGGDVLSEPRLYRPEDLQDDRRLRAPRMPPAATQPLARTWCLAPLCDDRRLRRRHRAT